MLYRNKAGRIIDEEELNLMSAVDIEEEGIHLVNHWAEWQMENS